MSKGQNKRYVPVREEMAKRMALLSINTAREKRGLRPFTKRLPNGWWEEHGEQALAKYDKVVRSMEKRRHVT